MGFICVRKYMYKIILMVFQYFCVVGEFGVGFGYGD